MKDNQQNNFANNMMNNNSMPMNNNIQNNMPNQFSNNYQNNNYLNNNMMPNMNNVGNNQMFDSNQQRNMMSIENDNMALNMGAYGQNFSNNSSNRTIIGIKNVTEHAGSTTITYLLMKEAIEKLRKKVVAIEINKRDFAFYHHNNMVSIQENEILNAIKAIDADIIFVDLNNCKDVGFCNDILYLVEPSLIKLNKLMMENKYVFRTLLNRKVVLNKSLLSLNDIRALSSEAGIDIFDNIEPVNDRISNNSILKLLDRMGIK
jgi:UDP-N-acetyl-D-mannosaminuronic acid transferase (WecB/TagA/CpsF family)